ncbi:hypothetical protein [Rubritalea squalenifaciens]|uniref:hypothetical protein n=1 Tax=Rubritalea squalenifaciens TaxID=407226 RepID=UPI0011603C3F|nr:hypothetical protein [Rubritalea squalenifaciens]
MDTAPAPRGWTKYRAEFFRLVNGLGYGVKEAADFVSDVLGHGADERRRFYLAARCWRNPEQEKSRTVEMEKQG